MNKKVNLSLLLMILGIGASAQLRVANWNVTNYNNLSDRKALFQTAFYGIYQGRQFAPDVILGQEFLTAAGLEDFKTMLNTAPGSPGDWTYAPFIDGTDTEAVCLYRSSKVQWLGTSIAGVGSSATTNQPRNTYRYDLRPVGYTSDSSVIAMISTHMKSSSGTNYLGRRQVEADNIVANINTMLTAHPSYNFLFGGDTNMQSSNETAFRTMVSGTWGTRLFFDPIKSPGTWNNNSAFRFIHTQDPGPNGQMDDRHDQLWLSGSLINGSGVDYVGNANLTYSTTTWNDPNHSYRCWGNDGSSYGLPLNAATNTMVGPDIAAALRDSATTAGGHLPVFLDLKMPPKVTLSSTVLNFGTVFLDGYVQLPLTIMHGGDTSKWTTSGLQPLTFSLVPGAGVTVRGAAGTVAPGSLTRAYVQVDTSQLGPFSRTLVVNTNDPDQPTQTVTITGNVRNPLLGGGGSGHGPRG
ncbi:MAG: hypothetical protein K8R88_11365 [Armatimonadetes bacterium]|nr:hypothetical protein [Armatimonadota bacterium]